MHIYLKLLCLLELISWSLYNVLLVIVFVLKSILFYKILLALLSFHFHKERKCKECFQFVCIFRSEVTLLKATYIGSCVCIYLATLCLLIAEIIPFVILHRFVHIAMLLIVCGLFCSTFLFPSAFVLFPCDLLTLFRVIFRFFYLLGVCIYYKFWFILPRDLYKAICISTWLFKVADLSLSTFLTTLQFHYPRSMLIFDAIFYIFLFCVSINYLLWI